MSLADVVNGARQAGFNGSALVMAIAVSLAENGSSNPRATNTAGNSAGTDRGLWQINSYYHPEVTDACAFDPVCSAQAAYRISNSGTNWNAWSTYKNGQYKARLSQASIAISNTSPAPGLGPPNPLDLLPNPAAAISSATASISTGLSEGVSKVLHAAETAAGVLVLLAGLALLGLELAGKSDTLKAVAKDAITVAAVVK